MTKKSVSISLETSTCICVIAPGKQARRQALLYNIGKRIFCTILAQKILIVAFGEIGGS
jgi:hypothetical protein